MTPESFFVLFRPAFNGVGVVLALVGGLIYLPTKWLETLGLISFHTYQRADFALCFWVGVSILLAVQFSDKKSILQRGLQRFEKWRQAAASKRRLRERLQRLTTDEKTMLRRFKIGASLKVNTLDGTVLALAQQGYVYRTSFDESKTTYSLVPQVRALLTDHPEILAGARGPRTVVVPPDE